MKIFIKILIHSIFWLVFAMFNYVFEFSSIHEGRPAAYDLTPHYFINIIWAVTAFYLFYFYTIKLFERRKLTQYLAFSIFFSIAITILFFLAHKVIWKEFNILEGSLMLSSIAGTFIISQSGSLVKGFENWFAQLQAKTELENLNLKNELELLKAQINPHFLFNTLNNIDSLINKSPAEASKALITLSEMLRYMIYDTKQNMVLLEKEIDYILSYIKLQKMRYKNPDYLSFTFDENCKSVVVAPVLFLVFIENAFKYSINIGKLPVIDIKLFCADNELRFYCMNYFNPPNPAMKRTGGVGLENVKRRLALLYPNKHVLKISSDDNKFIVDLSIKLV